MTTRGELALEVGSTRALVGGPTASWQAVGEIVAAGRRDVLAAALRGPSPEGRAWAALGLMALPPLDPADEVAIRVLRAQRTMTDESSGCIGSHRPFDEIVPAPCSESP